VTQALHHVAIAAPRNGTTTHIVDPSTGTVVAGSAFTPTAGRMLVCKAYGAVTSTTPTAFTLAASAINSGGLYVWYDLSCAGSDTITTTHNASNYPVVFDFYEFPAGTTWVNAVGATAVAYNGGAGPTISSLTGTNQVYGAAGQTPGSTASGTWDVGTEIVDTSVIYTTTDGYSYGVTELVDYASATASAAWTGDGGATYGAERLMWAVKLPAPPVFGYNAQTVATAYTSTGTQTTSHPGSASARAAVVLIDQNGTAANEVSGVTYGGATMTRLRFDTESTEAGATYIYWLDNVGSGTQNVAMTTTAATNKQLVVATMTVASGNAVAVAGHATGTSASVANPSWSITGLTATTKLEAFEAIHSGLTTMTTTPATSWTLISSTDLGAQGRGFARQSVASSGTSLASGWTASTADDFVGSSVAFYEVAGGPQGSGAGTTTFTGTATGARTPKGSAAGATTFTGTASGKRTPKGSAVGATAFTGTATGKRVPKGSASGATALTGAASGVRTPKGSASGTSTFTGTASGHRISLGSATGTSTFTGVASGARASTGSGSGTVAFTGAASGSAPSVGANAGTATGATTFTGSAAGTRTPKGSAAGASAFTGSATGTRTPKGSGTGIATWTGAAVGQHSPKGASTGATTWTGTATGSAPAIGGASGTASGSILWTGTATGAAIHRGTGAGLTVWTGMATGTAPSVGGHSGSGSGLTTWAGTASGSSVRQGVASGLTVWVGTAAGARISQGVGFGERIYVGTATGTYVSGDITVTGQLDPRRWAATLSDRAKTGSLTPRTKTGVLTDRDKTGTLDPRRWEGTLT